MSKINSLLDSPSFSDEYIISELKKSNITQSYYNGIDCRKNITQLAQINDYFREYYAIDFGANAKTNNYQVFFKRLLAPDSLMLFKNDVLSVSWLDKNQSYDFTLDKVMGNYPVFHKEILTNHNGKVYHLNLKISSSLNILDQLFEDSNFIYKFLIKEIYSHYLRNGIKKKSKADVDFYLRKMSPTEVLSVMMIAFPDTKNESLAKEFLKDFRLDHLLEMYKEILKN